MLVTSSWAGEVRGHVVAVRHTSKRRIAPPLYSMRAGILPAQSEPTRSSTEAETVVLFLEGEGLERADPVLARMEQKNAHFDPELVVVPVGSSVSFPNMDPIFHNVFSLSKAREFDLGYFPAGHTRVVKFDKPGVVQVFCHLHANMNAAIIVAANKYFTTSAPDGTFSISNVPAGAYKLVAWHRAIGLARRSIKLGASETLDMRLEIPIQTDTP